MHDIESIASSAGLIGGVSVSEARSMGLLKDDLKGEPFESDDEEGANNG